MWGSALNTPQRQGSSTPMSGSSCDAGLQFGKEIWGSIYTMTGVEVVKINDCHLGGGANEGSL